MNDNIGLLDLNDYEGIFFVFKLNYGPKSKVWYFPQVEIADFLPPCNIANFHKLLSITKNSLLFVLNTNDKNKFL